MYVLPTADVYIDIHSQPYLMRVGIATSLPYPILLGRIFRNLDLYFI